MGSLSEAKTLGGVGSILILLSFVPTVGGILAIIGFVLVLVAVKYISDSVGDRTIFNNMIIAVILAIIAIIALVVVVLGSILRFVGLGGGFMGPFTPSNPLPSDVIGLIVSIFLGLVVAWVLYLVSAVFLRRIFSSIASRLNVGMFGTVGLLYLIGAATLIILVGIIILFVAEILQIVAFFSIPDQAPQPPPVPGQQQAQ